MKSCGRGYIPREELERVQVENDRLKREVSELLQEQRVLQFGIENYQTMWLGNWPKFKDSVERCLAGQEKILSRLDEVREEEDRDEVDDDRS